MKTYTATITGTFRIKVPCKNGDEDDAIENALNELCGDDVTSTSVEDISWDYVEFEDREDR